MATTVRAIVLTLPLLIGACSSGGGDEAVDVDQLEVSAGLSGQDVTVDYTCPEGTEESSGAAERTDGPDDTSGGGVFASGQEGPALLTLPPGRYSIDVQCIDVGHQVLAAGSADVTVVTRTRPPTTRPTEPTEPSTTTTAEEEAATTTTRVVGEEEAEIEAIEAEHRDTVWRTGEAFAALATPPDAQALAAAWAGEYHMRLPGQDGNDWLARLEPWTGPELFAELETLNYPRDEGTEWKAIPIYADPIGGGVFDVRGNYTYGDRTSTYSLHLTVTDGRVTAMEWQ